MSIYIRDPPQTVHERACVRTAVSGVLLLATIGRPYLCQSPPRQPRKLSQWVVLFRTLLAVYQYKNHGVCCRCIILAYQSSPACTHKCLQNRHAVLLPASFAERVDDTARCAHTPQHSTWFIRSTGNWQKHLASLAHTHVRVMMCRSSAQATQCALSRCAHRTMSFSPQMEHRIALCTVSESSKQSPTSTQHPSYNIPVNIFLQSDRVCWQIHIPHVIEHGHPVRPWQGTLHCCGAPIPIVQQVIIADLHNVTVCVQYLCRITEMSN